MRSYYITHLDRSGMYDFSKKDGIVRAENIDNLRRNLIAEYVSNSFNRVYSYSGMLHIADAKGKYLGVLLFNDKEKGRAYWMKPWENDFYYPVSSKTGRISGEGMDYFRSYFKKKA